MKKKSRKERIRDLQAQWAFVLFGTLFAVLGGLTVNALYELVRENSSALTVLIIFGSLFLFVMYLLSFLFENLEEIGDAPDGAEIKIFKEHHVQLLKAFCLRIRKTIFKK